MPLIKQNHVQIFDINKDNLPQQLNDINLLSKIQKRAIEANFIIESIIEQEQRATVTNKFLNLMTYYTARAALRGTLLD